MKIKRLLAIAVFGGVLTALLPTPGLAWSAPKTLARAHVLGILEDRTLPIPSAFPIEYVGISWLTGEEPSVRFSIDGQWTRWKVAHEDDVPTADGRTFSRLIYAAGGADAYQLRGGNSGVKTTAINTTDGPRSLIVQPSIAGASHISQPSVISRQQWGADESYRFKSDGSEKWPSAFYATQKLVVHHTATKNDDPDPAATVRAIYRYHAIDKDWGDIGYNFLVDEQGRIYKGRYSGPATTWYEDTLTGENSEGHGVTAAHVGGYNSGTMGIAVLGNYKGAKKLPAAARGAVVDHLAWESERHGLDPLGSSTYVNPVNGATKENMPNISGHRDWAATECPGSNFYKELSSIRQDVAAKVSGGSDTTAPAAPQSLTATAGDAQVALDWADNTQSDLAGYNVYRTTDSPTSSTRAWTKLTGSPVSGSAYTDTGLVNGTTYYYFVTAVDASGNESVDSNEASATPAAPPASSSLHVHDLDGTGAGEPRGYWHAKVSVFVHDDNGNPVSNATVSYDWDVASSKPSCVTDGTGWCTVVSDSFHKGSVKSITLTVTGISHSTLAYSGANHDSEADSDGTSITVNKPN